MTTPAAVRFATYNRDLREGEWPLATRDGRPVVGPNTMGEYLTPVSCDFDENAGTSRVGFAYVGKGRIVP